MAANEDGTRGGFDDGAESVMSPSVSSLGHFLHRVRWIFTVITAGITRNMARA